MAVNAASECQPGRSRCAKCDTLLGLQKRARMPCSWPLNTLRRKPLAVRKSGWAAMSMEIAPGVGPTVTSLVALLIYAAADSHRRQQIRNRDEITAARAPGA